MNKRRKINAGPPFLNDSPKVSFGNIILAMKQSEKCQYRLAMGLMPTELMGPPFWGSSTPGKKYMFPVLFSFLS